MGGFGQGIALTMTDSDAAFQASATHAQKCEDLAASKPGSYRCRVVGLALIGYLFPLLVLAGLIAAYAACLWLYFGEGYRGGGSLFVKFGIALALLTFMVARSMWLKFDPVEGVCLDPADAPDFFAFIEGIRREAGDPRLDAIYVTDELNAAVYQRPRLGLLGWYRNELIVGLPLIQALTRHELAAVIAHEFGHLSGAHGKLGAWVYRSRLAMARILKAIEEKSYFGSWIFTSFYRRFAPFFAAYSFALAREQEYEADRMAASVISAQDVVDALVRSSLANAFMGDKFWGEVWAEVDQKPLPPRQIYARLESDLTALKTWSGIAASFDAVRARATDYDDTHPSLSKRAEALGVLPQLTLREGDPAIALLPNRGAKLIEAFSQQWQHSSQEYWEHLYHERQEQRQRLVQLDDAAKDGPLDEAEAVERGVLAEQFIDPEAALARYDEAVAWSEDAAIPLFHQGRILLQLGREEGVAVLQLAMSKDPDTTVSSCHNIEAFLTAAGRGAEAKGFECRRKAYEELLEADWQDRCGIARKDDFVPHTCEAAQVAAIAAILTSFKKRGLNAAWLMRKPTQQRQWEAAHFLVINVTVFKRWTEDLEQLQAEIAETVPFEGHLMVFVCDKKRGWLRKKAKAVSGSQIYPL